MNIPIQIEAVSIARATNAAHYEYLDTVRKRTEEIRLENDLWHQAVNEFRQAFEKEDTAFKQYRASLKTSPSSVPSRNTSPAPSPSPPTPA